MCVKALVFWGVDVMSAGTLHPLEVINILIHPLLLLTLLILAAVAHIHILYMESTIDCM